MMTKYENFIFEMAHMLFRPQWVNPFNGQQQMAKYEMNLNTKSDVCYVNMIEYYLIWTKWVLMS